MQVPEKKHWILAYCHCQDVTKIMDKRPAVIKNFKYRYILFMKRESQQIKMLLDILWLCFPISRSRYIDRWMDGPIHISINQQWMGIGQFIKHMMMFIIKFVRLLDFSSCMSTTSASTYLESKMYSMNTISIQYSVWKVVTNEVTNFWRCGRICLIAHLCSNQMNKPRDEKLRTPQDLTLLD